MSAAARRTALFHDERCFWHGGGWYAFTAPVGGLVQPMVAGGLPEAPETKRRLLNLTRVTGLYDLLEPQSAPAADMETLRRVHPAAYLDAFAAASAAGGGELGERTPFGPGGFEICALSAGLAVAALEAVMAGRCDNAYALCRPPGHHCLPDRPMGFCLLANLAVAIEAAIARGGAPRFAVIDWDVHHGNGTEAIFYERADVLTISLHQARNYPRDTGAAADRGAGPGLGANLNIPLPPGAGHDAYLYAFDRLAAPAVRAFRPDAVVIACGYDASGVDPLSRTLAGSDTFAEMTERALALAAELCGGRLMMAHEGGYSELHVPFCGHAVLAAGAAASAPDPLAERIRAQQPDAEMRAVFRARVDAMAAAL